MNRRRKVAVVVGSSVGMLLFAALWKAPVRMKRQFEAQATEQLQGTTSLFKGKFEKLSVRTFQYNGRTNSYDVLYATSWFIPNSPYQNSSVKILYRCSLNHSGNGFSGSCPLPIPAQSGRQATFQVAIHE
jgi:hypothetical protein